jgi:hypothetical protein
MPRKTRGLEKSNGIITKLNKMAESGKRQLIQRGKKNDLIDRLITVYNAPHFPAFLYFQFFTSSLYRTSSPFYKLSTKSAALFFPKAL